MGFHWGFLKKEAIHIGIYVSIKIGKVTAYISFLKVEQCILRHSVMVVILPITNMVRYKFTIVVRTDSPNAAIEPPRTSSKIAAPILNTVLKEVRTAAGQMLIVISKHEKLPWNIPFKSPLPYLLMTCKNPRDQRIRCRHD